MEHSCVYFTEGEGGTHVCQLHGDCVREGDGGLAPACDKCKDRLALGGRRFVRRWVDPLVVLDRRRERTDGLRNMLAGGAVFLAGGGPSANDLPLPDLNRRGCWTLCVNNMAGHPDFRPQAMVCSDPLTKFTHSVWLDPGVMKFVPEPKLKGRRANLRRRMPDGTFEPLDRRAYDCPNVWGYRRYAWLTPDDAFFLTDGALWGNHNAGVERTGQPKTVCTMLLGIRLLRYLGARRVYLIGCDFRMAAGYGYSFGQDRTRDAVESNNRQFAVVDKWLCQLQESGTFKKFGLELFNCFSNSGLRAFPHVPFDMAIRDARGIIEDKPDLADWYEK